MLSKELITGFRLSVFRLVSVSVAHFDFNFTYRPQNIHVFKYLVFETEIKIRKIDSESMFCYVFGEFILLLSLQQYQSARKRRPLL